MEEKIEKVKEFCQNHISRGYMRKPQKPCVILYNGERISLNSGKHTWPSKGAARTAFSNAINDIVDYNNNAKIVREALEEEGVLVFKELDV